jgi:hypothetical protein
MPPTHLGKMDPQQIKDKYQSSNVFKTGNHWQQLYKTFWDCDGFWISRSSEQVIAFGRPQERALGLMQAWCDLWNYLKYPINDTGSSSQCRNQKLKICTHS